MADFTLRQLELFSALPEFRTLSAAAAALHISESGLSHAISELEKAVGEQLCVRRKAKGLQLTPAGQFFAAHARALVAEADELVGRLASERGELVGPVELGCYTGISASVLPPVVDSFATMNPRVQIGLHIGADDELLPMLDAGRLDIVITYDFTLPTELHRRRIYETEILAVMAPGHPLAHTPAIGLADLASEPLILLDTVPSASNTQRAFAERGLTPNVRLAVPNLELVRVLVGRGLGYSLLMRRPNYNSTATLEGRPIVMRSFTPRIGVSSVVAVWPAQMQLSRRADALLNHLATEVAAQ